MKTIILCLFLFISFHYVSAQKDSIENEIASTQSKAMLIVKGRQLIVDKVLAGDKEKSAKVMNYLIKEVEDDYYQALNVDDTWFLAFWTGQYPFILKEVKDLATDRSRYSNKQKPPKDALLLVMRNSVFSSEMDIRLQIKNSEQNIEEKDFLTLLFRWMCMLNGKSDWNQDLINQEAQDFLKNFPASEYASFTQKKILSEWKVGKWGFGFAILGTYNANTNHLKDNMRNFGTGGFVLDIFHKKWGLFLIDDLGFSHTKNALLINNTLWHKRAYAGFVHGEIALAYSILDNQKMKISPFIGIAVSGFSPSKADIAKYPAYEKIDFSGTPAYTAGVNMDLKLKKPNTQYRTSLEPLYNYKFARFRLEYCYTGLSRSYPTIGGNILRFSIGFGLMGRSVRRK